MASLYNAMSSFEGIAILVRESLFNALTITRWPKCMYMQRLEHGIPKIDCKAIRDPLVRVQTSMRP